MDITITIPDQLVDSMTAFMQTQVDSNGNPLYVDLADMCQCNLNTGLFQYFVNQMVNAQVATETASVTASINISMPRPALGTTQTQATIK